MTQLDVQWSTEARTAHARMVQRVIGMIQRQRTAGVRPAYAKGQYHRSVRGRHTADAAPLAQQAGTGVRRQHSQDLVVQNRA